MLGNGELELEELLLDEELLEDDDRDELLLELELGEELEEDEDEDDGIDDEELLDWLCCSSQALTVSPSITAKASDRSCNALLIEGVAMTSLRFKYW